MHLKIQLISFFSCIALSHGYCQSIPIRTFEIEKFSDSLPGFRDDFNGMVLPAEDSLELPTFLSLIHYPELAGNKIKIRYKKSVRYPITASWSFWNFFKFKKNHVFILLLSEDTFVKRVNLDHQVAIIGHEMAHFSYYKDHPAIHMIWWGIKYSISKKFKQKFEKNADRIAIERGLGWQLLRFSFYMNHQEVKTYMEEIGYEL